MAMPGRALWEIPEGLRRAARRIVARRRPPGPPPADAALPEVAPRLRGGRRRSWSTARSAWPSSSTARPSRSLTPRHRRAPRGRRAAVLDDGTEETIREDSLGMNPRPAASSARCAAGRRARVLSPRRPPDAARPRRTGGRRLLPPGRRPPPSAPRVAAHADVPRRPRPRHRRRLQRARETARPSARRRSRSSRATRCSGRCRPLGDGRVRRLPRGAGEERRAVALLTHGSYLMNLASPDRGVPGQEPRLPGHGDGALPRARHPVRRLPSRRAHGARRGARACSAIARQPGRRPRAHGGPRRDAAARGDGRPGHRASATASSTWRRSSIACASPERLGVCLDTCHLYAAGYDLATAGGLRADDEAPSAASSACAS